MLIRYYQKRKFDILLATVRLKFSSLKMRCKLSIIPEIIKLKTPELIGLKRVEILKHPLRAGAYLIGILIEQEI